MQNYLIETDETGKELNIHGDSLFPIACYDEYFQDFVLKEVPWHWHEEIELVVVVEGATRVEYLDGNIEIKAGEGLFLNSNALHRMTQIGDVNCHIINFVLKPEFIGGKLDSRIYSEYIRPIVSNANLAPMKFSPKVQWESSIIEDIGDAFKVFTGANFAFEIGVRHKLTNIWMTLCKNKPELFENQIPMTEDHRRLTKIIKHIHQYYGEKLTVVDLAKVANISKTECYRLFNRTLQTTPINYILNHRLQMAAIQLVESDDTIINIAQDLGFDSPSYFSKKFKEQYKATPRAFRNKHQ